MMDHVKLFSPELLWPFRWCCMLYANSG